MPEDGSYTLLLSGAWPRLHRSSQSREEKLPGRESRAPSNTSLTPVLVCLSRVRCAQRSKGTICTALPRHGDHIRISSRTRRIRFVPREKEEQSHPLLWTYLEVSSDEGQTITSIPPRSRASVRTVRASLACRTQPWPPAAPLHLQGHSIDANELDIGFC